MNTHCILRNTTAKVEVIEKQSHFNSSIQPWIYTMTRCLMHISFDIDAFFNKSLIFPHHICGPLVSLQFRLYLHMFCIFHMFECSCICIYTC